MKFIDFFFYDDKKIKIEITNTLIVFWMYVLRLFFFFCFFASGGHYLQDVRSRARREKVEFKHNTCVLTQSGQVHVFTTCHLTYICLR